MAKGFRIQHRTLRGSNGVNPIVAVGIRTRPYPQPRLCPTCGIGHNWKHIHLQLDSNGTCLVSEGVFTSLGRAGAIQFSRPGSVSRGAIFDFVQEDDSPPPQSMSLGYGPPASNGSNPRIETIHVDFDEDPADIRERIKAREDRLEQRKRTHG